MLKHLVNVSVAQSLKIIYQNLEFMKKVYFAFLLLGISSLAMAQETVKLIVKENKVPCTGVAPTECLQVKEGKDKNWKYFYESIQGFTYEPGYEYKLKVEKNKRTGIIPADAAEYTYKLKKVVRKKKISSAINKSSMNFLDKKMILTQMNGKKITEENIYFTFNSKDQSVSGKSGCNRFNSTYKLSGDDLKINSGISTMMACDEKSMQLEREFHNTMEQVAKISESGNIIQFKDSKGKVLIETTIPTTQDIWSFIDGKEWKLFMLENVGMDYGNANITFNVKENKVTGNAGCNNFFGEFITTGDQITFKGLGSTKKMCADEEVMKNEAKFLKLLSDATVTFDVAEQTLNFYKNDRLVMMFGLKY